MNTAHVTAIKLAIDRCDYESLRLEEKTNKSWLLLTAAAVALNVIAIEESSAGNTLFAIVVSIFSIAPAVGAAMEFFYCKRVMGAVEAFSGLRQNYNALLENISEFNNDNECEELISELGESLKELRYAASRLHSEKEE